MKIPLFYLKKDRVVRDLSTQWTSFRRCDIRMLRQCSDMEDKVIVLSEHSTNQRIVNMIRNNDLVTPIVVISQPFLNSSSDCFTPCEILNGVTVILNAHSCSDHVLLNIIKRPTIDPWNDAFKMDQTAMSLIGG